ncbi:MAG TPA: hypothetical protein VHA56_19335 [Mucilaginibacter sp.]|nr:hypothetical protein [Mucilaginibacter sp.]
MKIKYMLPALTAFALCLYACKKDSAALINGKWNVVSDQSFEGVGSSNHQVDYTGQEGDYFDFRTNGRLYINEGQEQDTLTFKAISHSQLVLFYPQPNANSVPDTCKLLNFTSRSVTIQTPHLITPGGQIGRTIQLSR